MYLRLYFPMSIPPEQRRIHSLQDRNVYRRHIYQTGCDDGHTVAYRFVARGWDDLSLDLGSNRGF